MDETKMLKRLLNEAASEEEIELLKQALVRGDISIGGNVNNSVIVIGHGNTVELTTAALDRLNAGSLLGDLDRDLTGDEIDRGRRRLGAELPRRAPVLLATFQRQAGRLHRFGKTDAKALSESARKERLEALAMINGLCIEALDISFNALCLGEEPPEYDSRSPFRGLESFRPEDSEFFFGREALTQKVVGKIRAHPFLAMLGPSGSGKSSLVMAGLIPALGSKYVVLRPGAEPLVALRSALSSLKKNVKKNPLIIVDQFEELFTLTADNGIRKEFIARLLDSSTQYRVVLTLRSDFLGEVAPYRDLNEEIQNHLENVPPMDINEMRHAMEGQAGQVGFRFEADLNQQILDDVEGEPGAMPLLQHALWELWTRRHGRWLRASEYRAFGGVKQAITSTAERVYGECSGPEQEQIRDIFLRLTRLDENNEGRDTRRRVMFDDLSPSSGDPASLTLILNRLADARLIVKTVKADKTEIEVAHEALIRHWERLRIWLNEDRESLRLREGITDAAHQWHASGKDENLLNHRGGRLEDALKLRTKLNPQEQAYLDACIDKQKEQQQRELLAAQKLAEEKNQRLEDQRHANERLRNRNKMLLAVLSVASILAVLASILGLNFSRQTKVAEERAEQLRNLATVEQANKAIKDHRPDLALALAMTATERDVSSSKAFTTLLDAAYVSLSQKNFAICSQSSLGSGWVTAMDISPDDQLVAVGCSINGKSSIILLDLQTARIEADWTYPAWIYSLAFGQDGQFLLAGYSDTNAIFWNLDGTQRFSLEYHKATVSGVAVNPNGRTAATVSYDKTLGLWDVNTGEIISQIVGSGQEEFPGGFTSVAFSADGTKIVLGDDMGNIFVWNPREQTLMTSAAWDQHDRFVLDVAFSSDGLQILSGSGDSTIALWNTRDLARTNTLDVSKAYPGVWVRNVIFTPDGTKLLSALSNGVILLWDARSLQVIQHMTGHQSEVEILSVSSDGSFALSAGRDGLLRQWDLQAMNPTNSIELPTTVVENSEINRIILAKDDLLLGGSANGRVYLWNLSNNSPVDNWAIDPAQTSISEIRLSPDETSILVANSTGQVIHQVLNTHETLWEFFLPGENARSLDISSDGKSAIIGYLSGKIAVLDMETGQSKCTLNGLNGHTNSVNSVRFTPDGQSAVSGSNDYNVILWDLGTCKKDRELFRHASWVMAVALSPDGKLLATTSADATTVIWNLESNQIIHRLQIPENDVNPGLDGMGLTVDFSPDGQLLATGAANGGLAIWSVTNGVLLRRFVSDLSPTCRYGEHCFWVLSVKFAASGDAVWASYADGTLHAWPLIQASNILDLREWLQQNRYIPVLSPQEREAYDLDQ